MGRFDKARAVGRDVRIMLLGEAEHTFQRDQVRTKLVDDSLE